MVRWIRGQWKEDTPHKIRIEWLPLPVLLVLVGFIGWLLKRRTRRPPQVKEPRQDWGAPVHMDNRDPEGGLQPV